MIDVNGILESYKPNETGRIALGFEVEGTLSVRGPDVPDVVSKSPHEVRGSLKHWPGRKFCILGGIDGKVWKLCLLSAS